MAEEKETREEEELKDLDPKKDPKGGVYLEHNEYDPDPGRGVEPKFDKPQP